MTDKSKSSPQTGYVFNDLRLEGHFCDAVIKVQDVEFQVHKIILCECSSYFRWVRNLISGRKNINEYPFK